MLSATRKAKVAKITSKVQPVAQPKLYCPRQTSHGHAPKQLFEGQTHTSLGSKHHQSMFPTELFLSPWGGRPLILVKCFLFSLFVRWLIRTSGLAKCISASPTFCLCVFHMPPTLYSPVFVEIWAWDYLVSFTTCLTFRTEPWRTIGRRGKKCFQAELSPITAKFNFLICRDEKMLLVSARF